MNEHVNPPTIVGLRCLRCESIYEVGEVDYLCPHHANQGSDVGTLDVIYDYATIREQVDPRSVVTDSDRSIGRFSTLLPLSSRHSLPPLAVGGTPLTHATRLGASLGLTRLYVKDDGRNPERVVQRPGVRHCRRARGS